ncbi:hypothetical protein H5410_015812 [Solanum commersonii]|uniref:Uncharacterized protein n=1 Tax=Solanum commersonii TaxID=4109 RepID=A0A9J5ZVI7_SOLCO|nr:hypothetical protein H5410_015812 [Solanum commersonii]
MAESFNAWILGPRNKTIVTMLEEIIVKVMSRVSKSKAFAETWTYGISPMEMMSTTGKKRGKGQYERESSSKTGTRRGAGSGYKKRPKVVGQGVFVVDTGYTCINQGLSSSRRVNTGVVSSAHVIGDIGFKPIKGLKWKGKQVMTLRELQVQSVMHRIQTRSKVVGIQTRAQAKGKSPSKKTSYSLPHQDRNIAPSYGLDNYFGQSSHFEMTKTVGTSSNFHVSPTFDEDDYRETITQDEPIDTVNIDDRDLSNYDTASASDSDDLSNAEESGDNVPFEASSSDDDFLMPNRSPRSMSMSPCRNHEISYLDYLLDGPNMFGDTHDEYTSQLERYIKEHTCNMGTCRDGHFNLDVEMIASILRVDIEKMPRFPIKDCQTCVLKAYVISISRRKVYLDCKRAFEKVYGTWEGSFVELPRFMEALKHFNPVTIVEWKTKRHVNVIENVFNYVFWTFKSCIDGFVFCRPIISIDGIHVYENYDIELLIAIGKYDIK